MNNNKVATVLLGGILIAIAGISFLNEKNKNSHGNRCICVEGTVEREIVADTADWTLCFEHIGTDRQAIEQKNAEEKVAVNKFLIDQGISQEEIEMYNYIKEDYSRRNNSNSSVIKYRVGYFVRVKTDKLNLVTALKNNISKFLGNNYGLIKNSLKVSCSNQETINRELARLAAENAMERAKNLTKFLNIKLKKIVTIEAPNFWGQSSFPEADSVMLNGVGMISKTITNQAEDNASEAMTKQKMHASIRMKIAIK